MKYLSQEILKKHKEDFVVDESIDGHFVVDSQGRSGLMLFWKASIGVQIQSYLGGHIDGIIYQGHNRWRFTGFYGNPTVS